MCVRAVCVGFQLVIIQFGGVRFQGPKHNFTILYNIFHCMVPSLTKKIIGQLARQGA